MMEWDGWRSGVMMRCDYEDDSVQKMCDGREKIWDEGRCDQEV
jgi:hypothetical protein